MSGRYKSTKRKRVGEIIGGMIKEESPKRKRRNDERWEKQTNIDRVAVSQLIKEMVLLSVQKTLKKQTMIFSH